MTQLRTPRLILRRARPGDLEAMHEVLSDERAMTWWSTAPHTELQQTREWLQSMIESPEALSDDFVVTIDGKVIGKLGTYRLPEIGYILGSKHWGRGIAAEAMGAFLDHIFRRPDVEFLTADVDPRNDASLKLLKRFSFRETGRDTGTWHTHMGSCDSVYLRLEKQAHVARTAG